MVDYFNKAGYIRSIGKLTTPKVKAEIFCFDSLDGTYKTMIKAISYFVLDFNGISISDSIEGHHINHPKDNRFVAIMPVDHAEHGSQPDARFNNDQDFFTYVANDLFYMTVAEFYAFIYTKLREANII